MKKYLYILIAVMVYTSVGMVSFAAKDKADRGEPWQASWIGANENSASSDSSSPKDAEIVIKKAHFGVPGDAAKQRDLTAKVKQLISSGIFTVAGSNEFAGGDPAHGTVKHLVVEYTLNDKLISKTVPEDVSIDLRTGKVKTPAAEGLANQWTCFRREVSLKNAPRRAIARIAADSKYWLWINGKLVVFEGQLKRGPSPHDTYYDQVDLTKLLQKGDNTIAVLVWYFGKHGFSHKSSGKPGFVFDADIDGRHLLSNSYWKSVIHPSFEDTGAPHPNYRLPESNIRFDARNDLLGWQNPGFDDSHWPKAEEYGKPPCAPWNKLVLRPVPLWKDFGLKEYANAKELPKVSDGKLIKAKLPYNAQVTPYLKLEGPAGKLIDIRMDNYSGGKQDNVRAEYVTKDGVQEYESLGWMNGHEMHYTIPAGFKIHALKYRETGYNTEFTGTFECDDDFLNRYRQKALRTLYITMRDTYFDCPDRERAQWWGDMVNEMGEAFYALDVRSNGLAKKGILELASWQRPDNTIYSPIPAGNWDRELPMQMLNSVGYYGFWTYYKYSGDLETIRTVYPAVKRYLSIWKLGKNGLVVPRKGGWTWGDWGNNKDMTILYNGWYYLALKGQLNMAKAVGASEDIAMIKSKMDSIEKNFNKAFWNGKEYRSPGYKGHTDDRVHALAVISGLAGPEKYDAIRKVFQTSYHSSPYMEKYVGEALYVMRFEDDAITRTKKRFREMTNHHYTTLWEDWKIGGSGGGTINHAWCGGALTLLSQYGAGVAPEKPGYESYHVLPQMGPLKHIKTTVPSVKGDIHLELHNQPDSFSMDLTSPEGTNAIVGIPRTAAENASIKVNGTPVWRNGKSKKALKGLNFLENGENYIKFSVEPGKWSFTANSKDGLQRIDFFPAKQSVAGNIKPGTLRCEYLENPVGIDVLKPRLSWQFATDTRGWMQGAYRILVASSEAKLAQDEGDLWDSGKVRTDQSTQVEYEGKALSSHQQYYWKVMVWNQKGNPSSWSKTAFWSMGLLHANDWQNAEWIGFDQLPSAQEKPAAKANTKPKITITKALYGKLGDRAKQVELKERIQELVKAGKTKIKVTNDFAGGDPAFGTVKSLDLEYSLNGKVIKTNVNENSEVDLASGRISTSKPHNGKVYLPAPYLRKEFNLGSKVNKALVYATAQGVFELHLNGKRVGNEYLMPGWTDYRKRIYYRTYDVSDMLNKGNNVIGAILGDGWFRGNISNIGQNQYGNLLRLRALLRIEYADGRIETVKTGPDWKASFGPILESDMQAGESYDARREILDWNRSECDASQWMKVNVGSQINPHIQAYPGVPVRPIQELPTIKLTEPNPGKYVFDLGQNFSGWIRLKVKGEAGDKTVMRFGEMLNADGTLYTANLRSARATDTYILKGSAEEIWEPHFTFHGFRYVEIAGLRNKPTPGTVTGIVIHSDAPMTSSFECSNPMLNQLHSNVVWGQRSNYLEIPTDCPQRDERLGWTGDTQVFIRSGCYHQDVASFFTKWMVDLMDTQNAHGQFGQQAPVFHGYGSPAWADAGIICPWTIYKVYGDTRMIDKHYDAMARFIEANRQKGLHGHGGGFGDWLAVGSNTPKNLISAAYFAYSTRLLADMAEVLGKTEDATRYNKLFEDIRANFQKSFVKADGTIAGHSQTAYCLALRFNLLTNRQREQAAAHLVDRIKAKNYHLSVGFVGVSILLPTLTDIGRSDLAYRLIQNKTYPSWGYSIEQGATTIWERWNSYTKENGFGNVGMNSFNHYAYGACSEWMFRSMLGIDSDGAGFKQISMKPEFGDGVTWAKGHHDSIHGRIESDWKLDGNQFHWKIVIPSNCRATVYLPTSNSEAITESGRPAVKTAGITFLRTEKDRMVFSVESGNYEFKMPFNLEL